MRARALVLSGVIALSVSSAQAAPGELDPGFGKGGKVTTSFGSRSWDQAQDVAIQSDGKIVVAGSSGPIATQHFALVRYRKTGSLDSTFGTKGRVKTPLATRFDEAVAIALQPDGKIVAVGVGGDESFDYAIVARYNSDGSLDSSFGSAGRVLTPLGESSVASGVLIQPDGKIVVVGSAGSPLTVDYHFVVVRYLSDGSLDQSFGSGGWTSTSFGGDSATPSDVALGPNGAIVVAGVRFGYNADSEAFEARGFALARYRADGTLDSTFGSGGTVTTRIGDGGAASSVVIQPDGKIVAGGSTEGQSSESITPAAKLALVRYAPDGSLDESFGRGGQVITTFGKFRYAADLALLRGGRIAVALGGYVDFKAARYEPDGALDASFGAGGRVTTRFAGQNDSTNALAVQADGRLVVAGTTYDPKKHAWDFALVRYLDTQVICHVPNVRGGFARWGETGHRPVPLLGWPRFASLLGKRRAGSRGLAAAPRGDPIARRRDRAPRRQQWQAPVTQARELTRSTMWVVSHPLRFRMMEVLREGPATSARLARRLGESRGSMSYHLRILADVGAIIEAPELGTRRERWWRRDPELVVFANHPDVEGRAISERWAALFFARDEDVRRRFVTEEVPAEWRNAATAGNWFVRMTPEEAADLAIRLYALVHEIRSRAEPPADAAETLVSVSVLPVVSQTTAS